MIPHEYIEELTRRTDIVDVVGNYVQLKRKGRLYGGLCPFHSEKTPSFYVYPDTQSFYCFGCGVGGDVIHFVRRINSIDYTEAVKMLAARAGMPEPQEDDKTGRLRSRILSMNKEAARYFHACLNSTVEEARQARAGALGAQAELRGRHRPAGGDLVQALVDEVAVAAQEPGDALPGADPGAGVGMGTGRFQYSRRSKPSFGER